MPQSRVWKIDQAVEGLWRLKVAGGPDHSMLINPPTPVSDPVACLLGTFPNTYSWHENEMYGLPAMIDHIIKQNKRRSLW